MAWEPPPGMPPGEIADRLAADLAGIFFKQKTAYEMNISRSIFRKRNSI